MSNPTLYKVICETCGQSVSEQFHSKSCKTPVSMICSLCSKMFKNQKYLSQHYKTHFESSKYECKICFKQLRTKQNLKNHVQFVHLDCPRDKVCNTCDSKFKTTKHLKRHEKIHAEMLYHCEKCNKNFHFKYNKDCHVKICFKTL